jgi:hypothetical protein
LPIWSSANPSCSHHLTGATDTERAVNQWLKAGQYAAERSAHLEAIRHFDRGLATAMSLPEGPSRDRWEIELQLACGLALFMAKGFIVPEAAAAYSRARHLAERQGDPGKLFSAIYGLWQSTNGAGRIRECRGLSDRLLQPTADNADDGLRLQAHHSAWSTSLFSGNPARLTPLKVPSVVFHTDPPAGFIHIDVKYLPPPGRRKRVGAP